MGSLAAAFARLAPRRAHGISATLLPYTGDGAIDWAAFEAHVARTRAAGLDVAVNMDTGFGDLLSPAERVAVLEATRRALGDGVTFYAGAFSEGSRSTRSIASSKSRCSLCRTRMRSSVRRASWMALSETPAALRER